MHAGGRRARHAGGWRGASLMVLMGLVLGSAGMHLWLALRQYSADWWAYPERTWRIGRAQGVAPLLVAPAPAERFPSAWDRVGGPAELSIEVTLAANGGVCAARVPSGASSGVAGLDEATVQAARRWRFAPASRTGENTTVVARVANRWRAWPFTPANGWWLAVAAALWLVGLAKTTGSPPAQVVWWIAGLLAAVGWLMTARLAPFLGPGYHDLASRQARHLALALALALVVMALAGRPALRAMAMDRAAWLGIASLLPWLLVLCTPLGVTMGTGHRQWLKVPGLPAVQVIEFTKLLLVCFMAAAGVTASRASARRGAGRVPASWLARHSPILVVVTLTFIALFHPAVRDFGPLLLLAAALLAMLYLHGQTRQAHLLLAMGMALVMAGTVLGWPARWADRLAIWREPWVSSGADNGAVARGKEHQAQLLWMVSSGGLGGTGLGLGQPWRVTQVQSDFTAACAAEELGAAGCLLLMLLEYLLAGAMLLVARARGDDLEERFLSSLAAGCGLMLGWQTSLTLLGNVGLMPISGVTLPFVSYGGSGLVANFMAVGLVCGLARLSPGNTVSALAASRRARDVALKGSAWLTGAVVLMVSARLIVLTASRERLAQQVHRRADGVVVRNARFEVDATGMALRRRPVSVVRGRILTSDGVLLAWSTARGRAYGEAHARYAHLLGWAEEGHLAVGLERWLEGPLTASWPSSAWQRAKHALTMERRGYDVVTTLDDRLQRLAQAALDSRGYRGCLVAMVPHTGEIVAAVGAPMFDVAALDEARWLRAFEGRSGEPPFAARTVYSPGSTFKTLVAAAALESGRFQSEQRYDCPARLRFADSRVPVTEFDGRGRGRIGLRAALVGSSNVYFAQLGVALGWSELLAYAARAGFGEPVPMLPASLRRGEAVACQASAGQVSRARVPGATWPQQRAERQLASTAIGQLDVRMTALQMAWWTSAIANRGVLPEPSLVSRVSDRDSVVWRLGSATHNRRVMAPETARWLREAMEAVVAEGTGQPAGSKRCRVAAKTGTAQRGDGGTDALMIAFAPADRPLLAVAVVVEGQRGGGAVAGPVAREVLEAWVGRQQMENASD